MWVKSGTVLPVCWVIHPHKTKSLPYQPILQNILIDGLLGHVTTSVLVVCVFGFFSITHLCQERKQGSESYFEMDISPTGRCEMSMSFRSHELHQCLLMGSLCAASFQVSGVCWVCSEAPNTNHLHSIQCATLRGCGLLAELLLCSAQSSSVLLQTQCNSSHVPVKMKGGEGKGNRENKKQDMEIMEVGGTPDVVMPRDLEEIQRFPQLLLCFAKNEASQKQM